MVTKVIPGIEQVTLERQNALSGRVSFGGQRPGIGQRLTQTDLLARHGRSTKIDRSARQIHKVDSQNGIRWCTGLGYTRAGRLDPLLHRVDGRIRPEGLFDQSLKSDGFRLDGGYKRQPGQDV